MDTRKAGLPACACIFDICQCNAQTYADISSQSFHCLFCDGYEERGVASAGVLAVEAVANTQRALHLARMARRLTERVTIYTNGNAALSEELQAKVDGTSMKIDLRPLSRLEKGKAGTEMILHFNSPSAILTEGFLVAKPRLIPDKYIDTLTHA
jgi:hypothetical protein